MLKSTTFSLFLLVAAGSMQAMTILDNVDTSLLGQPDHQVTIIEGNHRTVYAAYPKESLGTLDRQRLLNQCASALSTTSFLYTGYKAIFNAIANGFNYITASESNPMIQRHVSAYIVVAGLSYALTRISWNAYDNVTHLYQRLMKHNTQDTIFSSKIPNVNILENNHEIATINAENPNLIWIRVTHEIMDQSSNHQDPIPMPITPYHNQAPALYPPINPYQTTTNVPMPSAPIITPEPEQRAFECPVCWEAMNKRDSSSNMALPCAHVFHTSCIRQTAADPDGVCPVCRTPITQNM